MFFTDFRPLRALCAPDAQVCAHDAQMFFTLNFNSLKNNNFVAEFFQVFLRKPNKIKDPEGSGVVIGNKNETKFF